MRLEVRVKSKVRIMLGFGVGIQVNILSGVRAEAKSTQSGQSWQIPSISYQGRLPLGWGPKSSHGGLGSLEKEEGSHYSSRSHTPPPLPPLPLLRNVTILTHTHTFRPGDWLGQLFIPILVGIRCCRKREIQGPLLPCRSSTALWVLPSSEAPTRTPNYRWRRSLQKDLRRHHQGSHSRCHLVEREGCSWRVHKPR